MTLDDGSRATTRLEKFAIVLFSGFAALIVLPSLAFSVIAIVSPGAINLGH